MALIMIVDDSPTEVHVMKTALEKHGFETMSAADGSECLNLAREVRPDLIFMDDVMPGVNGFQATRALTRDPQTKAIPVVMVTTKDQETDRIWGMRQGAVDYLVKGQITAADPKKKMVIRPNQMRSDVGPSASHTNPANASVPSAIQIATVLRRVKTNSPTSAAVM